MPLCGKSKKDKEIEAKDKEIEAKDKEIEELKKQNEELKEQVKDKDKEIEELKKKVKAPGLTFNQKEAEKKEFFAGVTMKDKHGKVVKMKNKDNAGFFLTLAFCLNLMKTGPLIKHTGPDPTPEQVVDEKRTNLGTQVSRGLDVARTRARGLLGFRSAVCNHADCHHTVAFTNENGSFCVRFPPRFILFLSQSSPPRTHAISKQ